MKNNRYKNPKNRLPFSAVVRWRYPYMEYANGGNVLDLLPDEAKDFITDYYGFDETYAPGVYRIEFDFERFTQEEDGYSVHFNELNNDIAINRIGELPYRYVFESEKKEKDVEELSTIITNINPAYTFAFWPWGGFVINKTIEGKEYPIAVKRFNEPLNDAKKQALEYINTLS